MIGMNLLLVALLLGGGADGALRVKTDVSEVAVFLDDKELGQTPITINPLAAGLHHMTLIKAGFQNHAQDVQIEPGAVVRLFIVMKPIQAPLPNFPAQFYALHQHRAGACIGTLTVTAEAIDYKSKDSQDSFHIPVAEIRSVVRSMGSLPDTSWRLPAAMTACRVETPNRGYGFFALDHEPQTVGEVKFNEGLARKTKELFEIVHRLWMDGMKPPPDKPKSR
jgi:hypothetical protein